jgi:uncharacterized protein (DUF1778 family)
VALIVADMLNDELLAEPAPDAGCVSDHAADERAGTRRNRSRLGENRSQRLNPRFTPEELAEVVAAAKSVGMTPTGFCADSALAAARGTPMVLEDAQYREELARLLRQLFEARTALNRLGTNVNQAVAQLHSTGEVPEWMQRAIHRAVEAVERLDQVVAAVDRRLR